MKRIQTTSFQNNFRNYSSFIIAKGFMGKTYTTPVLEFLIWLEKFGIAKMQDVTTKEMISYYEYLIERPNQKRAGTLAGNTIKAHLLAISMFLDNLLSLNEIQRGFIIPKFSANDQKNRNILTVEEIKLLYQSTENQLETALLSIGYGCGLRRSEMRNLNLSDTQLHNGMLIVRSGKGNKRREVPMSDTVLQAVKRYASDYRHQFLGKDSENAFFLNKKGNRMSGDSLNKGLKKIIERSQNQSIIDKEITLHCLRHSIAHHLMENNAGIDFIKEFLGHSFINTAFIYAMKNKKRTKQIINYQL